MVILGWESLDWVLHGDAPHAGGITTTRRGFDDVVAKQGRARLACACQLVRIRGWLGTSLSNGS